MRKNVIFSFREVPLDMNVVSKNDIFLSLFNFYKNLVKGDHRNYYNTIYAQMMKYLHRVNISSILTIHLQFYMTPSAMPIWRT